jgi:hypothetical protein
MTFETKEDTGKVKMSMRSWNRLHFLYHEVKKNKNKDVSCAPVRPIQCHWFKDFDDCCTCLLSKMKMLSLLDMTDCVHHFVIMSALGRGVTLQNQSK